MSHVTAMENDRVSMMMEAAKRTTSVQPPTVADFDWGRPCCFEPHQMERIEQLGDQAFQRLARTLKRLLRIEPSSVKVSLQYGKNIGASNGGESPHYMMLSDGTSALGGYLALPAAQAVALVSKFLGGTGEGGEPGREMSSLETALLTDIVSTVVEEFSAAMVAAGGKALKPAGQLLRARPDACENTECGCFAFALEASAGASSLVLAIPCAVLESVVSPADQQAARPSVQECAKRLQAHLGTATLVASAWIGQARLAMKDVLALEVGDVLALSTHVGQPVELLVQGQPAAHGVLATREGRYALQITGR